MLSILGAALTCLVALWSLSAAQDPVLDKAWGEWKKTHAKVYRQGEEASRRATWEKNLHKIQEHNREAAKGKHTYELGMNHLGDLTKEEFNEKLNGIHLHLAESHDGNLTALHESKLLALPVEVDWRNKGYITPVKDQGGCGSCWAFSATGALEALHFKKTGKLVSLSEQNLVDCSRKQGNRGCLGGYMTWAFDYVRENQGINSEQTYPYEGKNRHCRFHSTDRAATCAGYVNITKRSESHLEQAVAHVGPVSVAVDASEFMFYQSGIFFRKGCGESLNHGMLAVGYGCTKGDQKTKKYWILKNSWSETWGEKGYMRLARHAHNQCGVASMASYPIL